MTSVRRLLWLALAGGLLSFASSHVAAQRPDSVAVTLRVIDSAGVAVRAADVIVSVRGGVPVARTQTDTAGHATVAIPRHAVLLELLVRRIGFQPYRLDFDLPADQSMTINVVLADLAYSLDTVPVNARESVRHRDYFIDSATIRTSGQTIFDGWDMLRKLRPLVAYGIPYVCPGVREVWINGRWIPPETVVVSDMIIAREPVPSAATPHLSSRALNPRDLHRVTAMSALALIHPEHIAQMTFRDCMDTAIKAFHSTSAVFVVLKNGIAFDPTKGSYVLKTGKDD
jgi:Carboxypeptidase regulatory-like domain